MPPNEPDSPADAAVTPAVAGVLQDQDGRVLLVLRGNEPDRGRWSLPGGRVEPGESAHDAVIREMAEETGFTVTVTNHLEQVSRPRADGGTYVIDDFAVDATAGELRAGDDAADAAWFSITEIATLDVTPGLRESLNDWGYRATTPTH